MQVVRRDDRDDVDAIFPRRLGPRHLAIIRVAARRIEADRRAAVLRALRIARQGAGDDFITIVEARGDAVHRADEGAVAAADHPQAQPAFDVQRRHAVIPIS